MSTKMTTVSTVVETIYLIQQNKIELVIRRHLRLISSDTRRSLFIVSIESRDLV